MAEQPERVPCSKPANQDSLNAPLPPVPKTDGPQLQRVQLGHDYYLPLESPPSRALENSHQDILDHLKDRPDGRISDFLETHRRLIEPYAKEIAKHNFPEPDNSHVKAIAEKWITQLELETAVKKRLAVPEDESIKQLASEVEQYRSGEAHSKFVTLVETYAGAVARHNFAEDPEEMQYAENLIMEIEFGHNRLSLDEAQILAKAVAHRTIPDNDQNEGLVEEARGMFQQHALHRLSPSDLRLFRTKLKELGLPCNPS